MDDIRWYQEDYEPEVDEDGLTSGERRAAEDFVEGLSDFLWDFLGGND